jgi:hypothetical protein
MTEPDEKGIERACDTLNRQLSAGQNPDAREIIEAYLTEPPKWPTNETMNLLWPAVWGSGERLRTAAAMRADPIIKAAIELRDYWSDSPRSGCSAANAVIDAVNEAGL